ncbi:MAG: cadmium-translocating P-type ATPase [Nitrospiraceae bacterium]|nr:cadmium-translocating P-type ATPase [Nitrospiraceae bacterium]
MDELRFKIRGMDCAEEVATLKREVGPLVRSEDQLLFDVLNGKMTVIVDGDGPSEGDIVGAVARTGMQAVLWQDHVRRESEAQTPWARHGRKTMTAVSGLALTLGYTSHAYVHGVIDALTGGETTGHAFPWLSVLLYIAAILTGGWFIFPKAFYAAKRLRPDMNLLMTVAVVGAVGIGEWFEAGAVAFLFALAQLLESWSVSRARRAIGALLDLSPPTARYICPTDGDVEEKPIEDVPVGATVLVRPGEKIPLDGEVTKGSTTINQAPITGESMPVSKEAGDEVFAGTINEDGAIEFRATKAANDTTLAHVIRMVEEAQSRRAASEQWVERFAKYYTPAMMVLALLVAIVPPLILAGDWYAWFYEALVILVIACPCALVISTPVSVVAGLSAAARAGVLIKGGMYLEKPAQLKVCAMDKTGTLTRGAPEVQQVVPLNGHTEEELLARAATLESSSEHPLARAILRYARTRDIDHSSAEDFQILKGRGAEGTMEGRRFWIGSHRLLHEKGGEDKYIHEKANELENAGHSIVIVGNEQHVCGLISVADQIRPESKQAVAALKSAGIKRVVMLTGDNEGTAKAVAEACGVDEFHSELLPRDKVDAVAKLVAQYKEVAMVGDGVNDAPAMASASLGIAMGAAGTDTAIETADIALMSDDLSKLAWLVRHSRKTLNIIRQNIVFALGLKLVFIILALLGLATLWMAIAADMGASLLVIFNGLRLLKAPRTASVPRKGKCTA